MADFEDIKYPGQGGLNLDADRNVMPVNDYRYALNLIKYELENYGVLTNCKGNERKYNYLSLGTNKVIGTCYDLEERTIYFFVYNSNDLHSIIRYNSDSDDFDYILWEEPVLNFNPAFPIVNPFTIGSGDSKMLFWTDGYNEPRKLNIARALAYEAISTTTTTTTTTTYVP